MYYNKQVEEFRLRGHHLPTCRYEKQNRSTR